LGLKKKVAGRVSKLPKGGPSTAKPGA
jgi:hypothetical protein